MRSTAIAFLVVVLAPSLCAQERGFVRGLGGVTLGGAETSLAAGGGFGVRINRRLDLFAEAGAVQNAMTSELQDDLDSLAALFALEHQVPIDFSLRLPSQYGLFGSRINFPSGSVITPFVEIGAGAARVDLDQRIEVLGIDLTRVVEEEVGALEFTKLLLAAGGGISIAATRQLGFDVGYRYQRIFTDDPAITTNQVYVGVIWRF